MSDEKGDNRIYEIGYLLTSILPEEKLGEEVTRLKTVLESHKAFVFADEFPKLRDLAYVMERPVGGKIEKHKNAYFGWMKFEGQPENIPTLKDALSADSKIVRFLIIKTVREAPVNRFAFRRPEPKADTRKLVERPHDASAERPTMTEAELDKTIEELVVD